MTLKLQYSHNQCGWYTGFSGFTHAIEVHLHLQACYFHCSCILHILSAPNHHCFNRDDLFSVVAHHKQFHFTHHFGMWLQIVSFVSIFIQISVLYEFVYATQFYLNDECTVGRSNKNGTCRFVNDCPVIVNEALDQSVFPTLCGFQQRKEIICCPNQNQIIAKGNGRPESTTTRLSAES